MPSHGLVTISTGTQDTASDAWRDVRSDPDIQFEPAALPDAPVTPEWLIAIGDFLSAIFAPVARAFVFAWPVLQWVLLALAVVLVVLIVVRIIGNPLARWRKKPAGEDTDFTPDRAEAQALLGDADALAAQGRYGEAVRLLLARSIGQIASRRPDLVQPSSTARELSRLDSLPEKARAAFSAIARSVERALFALEDLSERDWHEARAAYADFALEPR